MSTDDRRLRERWLERTPVGSPPPGCPDPERIWRAVALESPASERRSLIDHAAVCAHCAETWRLAAGFTERTSPQAATVQRVGGWRQLALAAASIVAAVGLGWFALHREVGQEAALRATEPAIKSLLEDGTALPRERFLLRWTPGPPGTIYDVEVGTTSLKLVSRGVALTAAEYLVPASSLESLAPGTSIAWRVEATLPDGRVVASVTHFNGVRGP